MLNPHSQKNPNININLFMAKRLFFALFYKLSLWLCSFLFYLVKYILTYNIV